MVNLDYVDRLATDFTGALDMEDLLRICVSPTRAMEPVQHLEAGPNAHVFSSPNTDVRFLGAFLKRDLDDKDRQYAESGGIPVAAVIAFVGYGAAPINVFAVGQRLVLNNGFHRVFALRRAGIKVIPVIVQRVTNPVLEIPDVTAGLPKPYLLGAPRPVMLKDFFEPDFAITLNVRDRVRMVTLGTAVNQHDVPS